MANTKKLPTKAQRSAVVSGDPEGLIGARAWVARQVRFERIIRGLEHRAGLDGDEAGCVRS
jgi:hypothetical protein